MKVALDTGEVLEVALLEGDRVVGTLSLQIKGIAGGSSRTGRSAAQQESTTSSSRSAPKQRRARKPLSPETKAKMAAAQKARWEKLRAEENK